MDRPLISIIIPVYNTENYLRQCVESVLSQTYSAWQLILADDGSSDSSSEICDTFSRLDKRIITLHLPNRGVSAARNAGIEKASGKFITFIDADDMLTPQFLEVCLAKAQEIEYLCRNHNPSKQDKHDNKGVIVQTLWKKFSEGERPVFPVKIDKKTDCIVFTPEKAVESMLYQTGLCSSVWATLYSSSLFKNIRFSEGLRYEDLEIAWRLMLKAKKIVLIRKQLYLYRIHSTSFLNSLIPSRLDVLTVTERIENELKANFIDKYPSLVRAARDRRLSANFNIYGLLQLPNTLPEELQIETSLECKKLICGYRFESLKNRKVRFKNKIGILLTYIGGFSLIRKLAPLIYH